jgi:hypothetical protein
MLQWLYTYVASVCPYCFICFPDACCKCVYLGVAYVSHICYKCFIWMLCMFAIFFKCFFSCFRLIFQVFHLSFFLYIASVASGRFKSRSSVAHETCMGSERGHEHTVRVTQGRLSDVRRCRPSCRCAKTDCSCGCADAKRGCPSGRRPGASSSVKDQLSTSDD